MKKTLLPGFFAAWAITLLLFAPELQAQDKPEKGSVKLEVSFYQVNGEMPYLKVSTKTKVNKKFKVVPGVTVNLFIGEENAQSFLGRVVTKKDGTNTLVLPGRVKTQWDTATVSKFIATVTGNEKYDDNSAEIEITRAKIELNIEEKDSVRTINAKLLAKKGAAWVEVPEVELKFIVKRYFNDLQIGESASTTDASGAASTEFKLKIPGDDSKTILVGAKIEENDSYGNIQTTQPTKWGTAIVKDDIYNEFNERTLWATRDKTPYWLLIFPNLIIATVWGFIFYMLMLIVRIRKAGLQHSK
jgi:hypothetical protein